VIAIDLGRSSPIIRAKGRTYGFSEPLARRLCPVLGGWECAAAMVVIVARRRCSRTARTRLIEQHRSRMSLRRAVSARKDASLSALRAGDVTGVSISDDSHYYASRGRAELPAQGQRISQGLVTPALKGVMMLRARAASFYA